ncbi:MAG: methyltransferase [Acidimicrobiales bacterium]
MWRTFVLNSALRLVAPELRLAGGRSAVCDTDGQDGGRMELAGPRPLHRRDVEIRLAAAGCVAAREESAQLVAAARDGAELEALVARRTAGEPLAWLVGAVTFCGIRVTVHPGVYVPRRHTEALARRAAAVLPDGGVAVDLCTGSGAIACVLRARSPSATVVATDLDPAAVTCARENGVDALVGDLDDPLPSALLGAVDVMTAVVPYVLLS